MEFLVAINSHAICYAITIFCILSGNSAELFSTCILYHTTYVMYYSNKLRRITPEQLRRCLRNYIIYQVSTVLLVFVSVVGYDMAKDNYDIIILPNGRCIYANQNQDDTFQIPITVSGINKIAQLVMFITYL